jgi:hypothetical protein
MPKAKASARRLHSVQLNATVTSATSVGTMPEWIPDSDKLPSWPGPGAEPPGHSQAEIHTGYPVLCHVPVVIGIGESSSGRVPKVAGTLGLPLARGTTNLKFSFCIPT